MELIAGCHCNEDLLVALNEHAPVPWSWLLQHMDAYNGGIYRASCEHDDAGWDALIAYSVSEPIPDAIETAIRRHRGSDAHCYRYLHNGNIMMGFIKH